MLKRKSNFSLFFLIMFLFYDSIYIIQWGDFMLENVINFDSLFEKILVNDKDGILINELIKQNILNISDINNYISSSNNFDYLYFCAKSVNGIDVDKIVDRVIESNSAEKIYKFANEINDVNINKLEKAIIDTKNVEYAYKFAKYIQVVSIKELQNVIINSNNAEYIYKFAKEVPGANVKELERAIVNTSNSMYICYFVKYVKGVNVCALVDKLIELGDALYIGSFAIEKNSELDEELMNKIVDRLIEIRATDHIANIFIFTNFCRNKILDALIELDDANGLERISAYLHDFDIDYDRIANVMLNSNNPVYISWFYCYHGNKISALMQNKIEDTLKLIGDKKSLDFYYRSKKNYCVVENDVEVSKVRKKKLINFMKK